MKKFSKWWLAGAGALILTAAAGVGAVMAQESTPSPGASTTQETPDAQETPSAQETPDSTMPDDGTDDGDERRAGGCGVKGVAPDELATFLGITVEQLRTELAADGATLATVASTHGQSREALVQFLTDQTEAALAERVTAGDLTQAEADEKLAAFNESVDEIVDGSGLGHGRRFRGGDDAAPDGATFSGFRS